MPHRGNATISASERSRSSAADRAARASAQRVFDRPMVVEAGAGTGKTSLLVARIVAWALGPGWERAKARLAEGSADGSLPEDRIAMEVFGRVAAVTFTEAAAAEMARRSGEALAAISDGETPIGVDTDALPADADVCATRARALIGALDHLVVRTIHAFCRRMLAQNPLEAGLHPGFEVDADALVQAEVVRETVEAAIHAGYGDPGDDDLVALGVADVGPARIETALADLVKAGVPESALVADPFPAERIAAFLGEVSVAVAAFAQEEAGRLRSATGGKITGLALDAIDATATLISREREATVDGLAEFCDGIRESWDPKARGRLKAWADGGFNKGEQAVLDHETTRMAELARALFDRVDHAREMEPQLLEHARRALGPLLQRVEESMRIRGAVTYAALLRKARDVLRDHPSVRRRVRGELDQLLIDEFQDTDPLQCEMIRWIALEGPEDERPGLFLVGDPKQSIYGWRSADLGAYDDFVEEVLGPDGDPERLSENFRSFPAILDEVARVVAPVMQRMKGIQPAFQPLIPCEQREETAPVGPCVEHWVSWEWDAAASGPSLPKAGAAAQLEARALARDLRARHTAGELAWSDVGVLFRAATDQEIYLQELREVGIPYAVERDRGYYQRREIVEASALARCVLDRNDHVALVAWLRSASVGVPDAALLPLWSRELPAVVSDLVGPDAAALERLDAIIAAVTSELPAEVPGLERVAGWDACLSQALAALAVLRGSYEDPADVFVEKLRTFSLIEVTEAARFLGRFRVANLDRFFRDLIGHLEAGGDRETLLRRLRGGEANDREVTQAGPRDAAEDAVRIMTIHKAKGLDFKHTYLVQLHKESGRGRNRKVEAEVGEYEEGYEYRLFGVPTLRYGAVAQQAETVSSAERVRSLYVAMTRAKDRLVLLGKWKADPTPVEPDSAKSHCDLLASRAGLPDLAAEMIRLAGSGEASDFVEDGVRWSFPFLHAGSAPAPDSAAAQPALPAAGELRAYGEALQQRCVAAQERSQRPWSSAPSSDSHAEEREERANGRYEDATSTSGGGAPSRTAARIAGVAVHRILEDFELSAQPAVELERQRRRLPDLVASLGGEAVADEAVARAEEVLASLDQGQLLAKLVALEAHVVSRELPVLLPPTNEASAAVGFVAGSIDLVYRDPQSAQWVVVDYKTDRVADDSALSDLVDRYASQGRSYQRAVREAMQLDADPRFELWFLGADRVKVVA